MTTKLAVAAVAAFMSTPAMCITSGALPSGTSDSTHSSLVSDGEAAGGLTDLPVLESEPLAPLATDSTGPAPKLLPLTVRPKSTSYPPAPTTGD